MKITSPYFLVSCLVVLAILGSASRYSPYLLGLAPNEFENDTLPPRAKLIQETSLTMKTQTESGKEIVPIDQFLGLVRAGKPGVAAVLDQVDKNWDISYVPILLEVSRFMPTAQRVVVVEKLQSTHPDYGLFKAIFYSRIDPRFSEYFVKTEGATIRLDEVRWGGVRRDGIPPLKNPKMLTVAEADYLADTDVVFGIDLNGDARCYPKRILAWHEMFKDTIGGESVCGVY